jgi:hypothetical protein
MAESQGGMSEGHPQEEAPGEQAPVIDPKRVCSHGCPLVSEIRLKTNMYRDWAGRTGTGI